MNYLSLCSGIEAATQAWHPLGWTAEALSEIEAFPSAVLAHHYPQTPNLGDMTQYEKWNIKPIDLLVGGTPCQSFSVAGLRKGLDDPRGNLMLTYLAIAARFKPRWIVWENVPGVLSSNGGRDFGTFLGGLAECGYGFAYRVLDAQYCRTLRFPGAVPQRRRRVFVVGYFGDWRRAAAVLFDRESLRGNPPPRREAGQGTAADAGKCVEGSLYKGHPGKDAGDTGLICTTKGSHWDGTVCHPSLNQSQNTGGIAASNQELFSQRGAGLAMATGQAGAEITEGHSPTLNCNHEAPIAFYNQPESNGWRQVSFAGDCEINGDTGELGDACSICEEDYAECECPGPTQDGMEYREIDGVLYARPEAIAFERRFVRTTGGQPQAGVNGSQANGGGQVAVAFSERVDCLTSGYGTNWNGNASADNGSLFVKNSMSVRRLTPVECERLQGFPDDWTKIKWRNKTADQCPDGPRYKALGNSMAVNCMKWIGQRINHIESTKL